MEKPRIIQLEQELPATQIIGKTTFQMQRTFSEKHDLLTVYCAYLQKNLDDIETKALV